MLSRFSYSNVVATIALFVALGGSSYAAVKLSKNSVKSTHIANGQVKNADLGNNAVTSSKIRNGALQLSDFNGQVAKDLKGATGSQGPQGAKGETGQTGPTGTTVSRLHWNGGTTGPNSTQAPLTPDIERVQQGNAVELYTGRASITAPAACPGGGNMDVIVYETDSAGAERALERRVSFSDVPAGQTRTVELHSSNLLEGVDRDPEPGTDTNHTWNATSLDYCTDSSNWVINSVDVQVVSAR